MKSLLFLSAAIAVLAAYASFIYGDGGESRTAAAGESYMDGVEVLTTRAGHEEWSMKADRIRIGDDGSLARIEGVRIEFPDRGLTIRAEGGSYDIETRDMELTGEITAEAGGRTVRAESVSFDAASEELRAEGRVVLTGDSYEIEGRGLRATRDTLTLQSDVHGVFR